MRSFVLTAVVVAASFASTGVQAGCVKAGGEATMLTEDLAKFMANAALNNQIKANGWKASGKVQMMCEAATLGTHCVAHQKACK
ncbi:MAG: hypothetical protein KJ622_14770 [Alphaproteobacteria bacterium]|nr:hypothetical protein [Alphaproteobacteria bacterium]